MSKRKQPPAGKPATKSPRAERRRMIAVTPELYELIATLAAKNGRPISWEVRNALLAHLKAAEGQP